LKIKFIIFFISLLIINFTKIIKIDNLNSEVKYEDDFDFSQYKTKYKFLAIFYPQNYINKNENEKNLEFLISPEETGEINNCRKLIKKQVELAKNHGIFGFGIVYNLIKENKFNERIINLFLKDNMNNFPFFIIFNNSYELLNGNNFFYFTVEKIKKYIFSENYIIIINNLYDEYDKYIKTKRIKNFFTVNGSHPEKFYLILKKYLNLTKSDKDIFIINAWNDYQNNLILSPQKEFGFLYLNSLSKAIFNLEGCAEMNLKQLENISKIAIQIHLFYLNLMEDIINKTNNIPVKFDLYITIIHPQNYKQLESYIKQFSKANYFEILIVKNKGRDVLPFLTQIKTKYRSYKYLCHIHTKNSKHSPELGNLWRNYLYNNLLGNIKIISEILFDFEKNKKLGFIFPEAYYKIVKFCFLLPNKTKKWMEFLAYKLFPNCKLDSFFDFPAGNMFWSKTAAIYQIFTYDLKGYFPKERKQLEKTIMHGIERIWLYLVKFNHFEYKIIFKSF